MRRSTFAIAFACVALAVRRPDAQTRPGVAGDARACGACPAYGAPAVDGVVRDGDLAELSGLAASHRHAGVFYTHNDSGDRARFFAVRANGAAAGRFELAGARAIDCEDIAVGPCPAGSCVYLADTGDNDRARGEYAIYRAAEPEPLAGTATRAVPYARLPFVYPDGAHDAESLVVDPVSGALYVLTKVFGSSRVYRVPVAPDGARTTAVFVARVAVPSGLVRLVTGADAHPCEHRLLVRTYDRLFEFVAPPDATSFEAVFAAPSSEVPVALETQGEAVAYRADGRGYVTASEGRRPALHGVGCR